MSKILKRGMVGDDVVTLQLQLKQLNYEIQIDGIFGRETEQHVKTFQLAYGLKTDGIFGPNTSRVLSQVLFKLDVDDYKCNVTKINNLIINEASKHVGEREIRGNMGFINETFHKLMVSVGFKKTHPWCSYFTHLVYREAYSRYYTGHDKFNNNTVKQIMNKYFSPSVMSTWNKFRRNNSVVISQIPIEGALIVWQSKRNKLFGHIGIVTKIIDDNTVETIEGNTDGKGGREGIEVSVKIRSSKTIASSSLQLLGFIYPPQLNKL